MAYKQKWGMSRSKSPLNNTEKPKSIMDPNYVDENPNRNDIIQQNNNLANQNSTNIFTPGIDLKSQAKKKALTKIAKSGVLGQTIKKGASFVAKANPIATFLEVFLGSQSAYAPNMSNDQMQSKFDLSTKLFNEEKRKKDIAGMGKKEIAEYDKKQREADLKWKYFDSKNAEHILQGKTYKPKHEFKQG